MTETTVFETKYKVEIHFKQSLTKVHHLAIKLHIHNLIIIINETYFNCKLISEKSIFKNLEQV